MEQAGYPRAEPRRRRPRHASVSVHASSTERRRLRVRLPLARGQPELFAHALAFEELDASARPVPALSEHARAPADLHSLFLACIHRVAHHYDDDSLVWLCDIHLLSQRLDEDDWDRFAALAQRTRMRTVCAHGLRAAAEAFGALLPPSVLARLSTTEHEPAAAFLAPSLRTIDVELSTLRQLPTWRARAELVWQHLFPKPAFIMKAYGVEAPCLATAALHTPRRAWRGAVAASASPRRVEQQWFAASASPRFSSTHLAKRRRPPAYFRLGCIHTADDSGGVIPEE